ncbi:hypothetical protein [Paraburkholderia translucens]|nr:hypothetical protein [Paraburkholderia sp. MMS20-SJTN17]
MDDRSVANNDGEAAQRWPGTAHARLQSRRSQRAALRMRGTAMTP